MRPLPLTLALSALLLAGTAVAAAPGKAPAVARATQAASTPVSDESIRRPGSFSWAPERSPAGPVVLVVSLPEQRMHVYRNGVRIAVSTVSTGVKGRETPPGSYEILQKQVMHHSNLYDDAPMPFMQRITWDGLALHAGRLPGYPASHGCVRMPRAFAEKLYGLTRVGARVLITDDSGLGELDNLVHPGPEAPVDAVTGLPNADAAPGRVPAAREVADASTPPKRATPAARKNATGSASASPAPAAANARPAASAPLETEVEPPRAVAPTAREPFGTVGRDPAKDVPVTAPVTVPPAAPVPAPAPAPKP